MFAIWISWRSSLVLALGKPSGGMKCSEYGFSSAYRAFLLRKWVWVASIAWRPCQKCVIWRLDLLISGEPVPMWYLSAALPHSMRRLFLMQKPHAFAHNRRRVPWALEAFTLIFSLAYPRACIVQLGWCRQIYHSPTSLCHQTRAVSWWIVWQPRYCSFIKACDRHKFNSHLTNIYKLHLQEYRPIKLDWQYSKM